MVVEPGVVPSGTSLLVRTNDTVITHRALRGTVYDARIAEDVVDQNGTTLIPKDSTVALVVRRFYLGPGGVGMTELTLAVQAVTVNGVRYPVKTARHTDGRDQGPVVTTGSFINVPSQTRLTFKLEDPIRLKGYQR